MASNPSRVPRSRFLRNSGTRRSVNRSPWMNLVRRPWSSGSILKKCSPSKIPGSMTRPSHRSSWSGTARRTRGRNVMPLPPTGRINTFSVSPSRGDPSMLRTKGFHCGCAWKSTNTFHTLRGGALISIVVVISCISHFTFRFGAPEASWASPAQLRPQRSGRSKPLVSNTDPALRSLLWPSGVPSRGDAPCPAMLPRRISRRGEAC